MIKALSGFHPCKLELSGVGGTESHKAFNAAVDAEPQVCMLQFFFSFTSGRHWRAAAAAAANPV
jgi:hypothetical protein